MRKTKQVTNRDTEKKTKKNKSQEEKDPSSTKKKKAKKAKNTDNESLGGFLFAKMARGGAAELRTNADEVNRLNVFPVPDGDTGDNMRMTIESGIAAIENLNSDNLAEVMRVLSHGMLLGARGNSGVILSQFFAGVAEGFKNSENADAKALGEALKMGVKQAYGTVMTPTEGTILTVAREAVEYAVSKITDETTIKSFFANLVDEMYASLERTPEILPALKAAGVVDSGGAGLFYIMDGFRRVLNGEAPESVTENTEKKSETNQEYSSFGPDSKMTFSYCTELLLQLLTSKCDIESFSLDEFRNYVSELGDSVCAVKADSIVKLHVHTFTPEAIIAYARKFGELISVKIENMSLQHSNTLQVESNIKSDQNGEIRKQLFAENVDIAKKTYKKYGIVAVSSGEGLTKIFYELGADKVISGGQSNNPSARDFLDAFSSVKAESIFVFPNNSNIILAAKQAAELYGGAGVYVIETKSIGAGYAALASFEFDNPDVNSIIKSLMEAITAVACGHTSPAIRDASINDIKIKKGDTLGIIEKRIVLSKSSVLSASAETALKLLRDRSLLTLFTGADQTQKEVEKVIGRIKKKRPDAEIFAFHGGQEIYPYIFVAR